VKYLLSIFLVAFYSTYIWAHGEDLVGPHGGFIRMPGAYHTEIVPLTKNQIKIYLLDLQWKPVAITGSFLQTLYQGDKSEKSVCEPKDSSYYICSFSENVKLDQKGKLIVNSQFKGQTGNEVLYELPLKFQ
jgi:hypothetical protein